MVGGGSRKNDGLVINNTNVFAALDTLRKKKKHGYKGQGSSKGKGSTKPAEKEPEKQVFWAPAPLTAKSWADVDDEDDDDYYATNAPPVSAWGEQKAKEEEVASESESEMDDPEEVDDVDEEEPEHQPEPPVEKEPVIQKPREASEAPKDSERQLSKKELKKKGLEELDAVLAELGYTKKESGQDHSSALGGAQGKKSDNHNGELEKKENATRETKSSKKKKKKDKISKEPKESKEQHGPNTGNGPENDAGAEKVEDTTVDVKERLKKVTAKKKKANKEKDAAARAAATEAAARSAKLAAAKKKEKSHYYQQPVR